MGSAIRGSGGGGSGKKCRMWKKCCCCSFSSLLQSVSILPGGCIHAHSQERLLCCRAPFCAKSLRLTKQDKQTKGKADKEHTAQHGGTDLRSKLPASETTGGVLSRHAVFCCANESVGLSGCSGSPRTC